MKILAIRGQNLASLAGEFAVELDQPPLSRAGVFAITGPTGAGKSTLLDALCLALFQRTPRLTNHGGSMVGLASEDPLRLRSNDARSLLRRGAVRGYAEVDFLGADLKRWRVRWSVRRARDRADGTLQTATVELKNLPSEQRVGGTLGETQSAIEEKLGMNFDQFRRSCLLAQGDFAAFLKALPKERANLLEQMTGTDIYRRLGEGAWLESKVQKENLERLRQQVIDLPVLTEEERAALLEEGEGAAAAMAEVRERAARLDRDRQWYQRFEVFTAEMEEALSADENARTAWKESEELRQERGGVERARPLLPRREEMLRTAVGARQAKELHRLREEEETLLRVRIPEAQAATARAREEEERAATSLSSLLPQLEVARRLDAILETARHQAQIARGKGEELSLRRDREGATLKGIEERRLLQEEERVRVQEWLSLHQQEERLAREWSRWEGELNRMGSVLDGLHESSQEKERLEGQGREWEEELQKAVALRQTATAEARVAEENKAHVLALLEEAPSLALLQKQRAEAEVALRKGESLVNLAGEWVLRSEELKALLARVEEATACVETEARRIQEQEEKEADLNFQWEVQEELRNEAMAARLKEEERASLLPGHPCPLCGSLEHPYASPGASPGRVEAIQRVLSDLKMRREQVRQESQAAHAAHARALEGKTHALARVEEVETRLRFLSSSWKEGEFHRPPLEGGALGWAAGEVEAIQSTFQRLHREEEGLIARLTEREEADQKEEKARSALGTAAAAEETALARSLANRTRLEEISREIHRLEDEARRGAEDLSLVLIETAWREGLTRERRLFMSRLSQSVREYLQAEALEGELGVEVQKLLGAEGESRARWESLCREAGEREDEAEKALAQVRRQEHERGNLWGGEATTAVEGRARNGVTQAMNRRQDTEKKEEELRRQSGVATVRKEEAERRALDLENLAREAEIRWQQALADLGLEESAAQLLLDRTEAWMEETREILNRLQREMDRSQAVLSERTLRLEQHLLDDPPGLSAPQTGEALAQAQSLLGEAQARVFSCKSRLDADDSFRQRRASFQPILKAQEEKTHLWVKLSDLIGDAKGVTFQSFAQGLTLDHLLACANDHLSQLSDRYRLERIPGEDLDLQVVDTCMGDEVRTLNSLSGGETFLASLALALGLSSLSSRTLSVESLFIDEGFGTLDPDTLDVALGVLESLQARGQQVGLISHVPGMSERTSAQVRVIPLARGRSKVEVVSL